MLIRNYFYAPWAEHRSPERPKRQKRRKVEARAGSEGAVGCSSCLGMISSLVSQVSTFLRDITVVVVGFRVCGSALGVEDSGFGFGTPLGTLNFPPQEGGLGWPAVIPAPSSIQPEYLRLKTA